MKILILFTILFSISSNAQNIHEINTSIEITQNKVYKTKNLEAIYQLIERVLPGHSKNFRLANMEQEEYVSAFRISSKQGKILLEGTDNIALAKGFYHYLRFYLKASVTICGSQIPPFEKLPEIEEPIFAGTQTQHRLSFNYCTFNYSFSFWDWDDWEKEIDWLAMQGVNQPLAITGTEAVWQNTLKHFNFSNEEIAAFIPGPAYNSWWLMDNLEGWGGPVSQKWIQNRAELQKKILARMRELGMEPILPAFYGMAPNSVLDKFPKNNIYRDVIWNGFQRPAFIDPGDSLFAEMAEVFYSEQEKLYGKALFYSGDPFHEGGMHPPNVTLAAKKIQEAMQKHSPNSTWVLQGWQKNPTDSLLMGTDKMKTLILDLNAAANPMYEKREAFGGRGFLWCNINNYGNNTCMYARLERISTVPVKLLNHKYTQFYKGIGICSEGDFTDPMVYDLFYDMAWQDQTFRLDKWLDNYTEYRYGAKNEDASKAFSLLANSVYKAPHRTENIMCARPSLSADRVTTWGPGIKPAYSQDSLFAALNSLLAIEDEYITKTETYRFDLSNVCRQLLTGLAYEKFQKIRENYSTYDKEAFRKNSRDFLDLILFADSVVSAMPNYSFYKWQKDAQYIAPDNAEKPLFLWNANRLVTLWGNREGSERVHDYAYREWYGLLSNFYYTRWKMYFDYLNTKLEGKPAIEPDFYKFEDEWCNKSFNPPEYILNENIKQVIRRVYNYAKHD